MDDTAAQTAIDNLRNASEAAIASTLPDAADLARRVADLDARLTRYAQGNHPAEAERIKADQASLQRLKAVLIAAKELLSRFDDMRKSIRAVHELVYKLNEAHIGRDRTAYTTQSVGMAYFSGKTVTETITCKDGLSDKPVFDNIIFTAYYETVPRLDVSIGAVGSLLGGRQVGTLTGRSLRQRQRAAQPRRRA